MGFAFFFFIAWLTVAAFGFMKKQLTLVENTVVLLLITVISINWSWIIFEELKLVVISREPVNYTAFLIHRSITVPLIVVITINLVKRMATNHRAWLMVVGAVLLQFVFVLLGRFFGISHSVHWNLTYDLVYFAVLQVIAHYFLKYYRHLGRRGVERA
ncbi:hypothetical protein PM3016_4703 [Paenibacillus mucilaginosus 3016]|uniref:Uncharacterized protein n=2 Tax=Paenibacillus mucilaginosus TaxID=61624 RepID=H6NG28_9BACL|nr:hypothetical protein PM3016_4703 [Paenibacillus mucilaginosus 3016]WFA19996.1 hypothetical protein ERY13_23535 [Paenibacillus mucilaginosus]